MNNRTLVDERIFVNIRILFLEFRKNNNKTLIPNARIITTRIRLQHDLSRGPKYFFNGKHAVLLPDNFYPQVYGNLRVLRSVQSAKAILFWLYIF